jgi:hypothetical protein
VNIIECALTREIPTKQMRCYRLTDKYTQADAERDYLAVHHVEPKQAYQWGNFLYIELPEETK